MPVERSWAGVAALFAGLRSWAICLLIFGVVAPAAFGLYGDTLEIVGEWAFAVVGAVAVVDGSATVVGVVRQRVAAPLDKEPFRWWWLPAYAIWLGNMFSADDGATAAWRFAGVGFGVWLLLLGAAFLIDRGRQRIGRVAPVMRAGDDNELR